MLKNVCNLSVTYGRKKPVGKKRKKKPVVNQPARYYKKPAGKKPVTKKKDQNQWTKNQSENHWGETNRL